MLDDNVKRMSVTKMVKTVTKILKFSPTHFVSNICHQHLCSQFNRIQRFNYVNNLRMNNFLKEMIERKKAENDNNIIQLKLQIPKFSLRPLRGRLGRLTTFKNFRKAKINVGKRRIRHKTDLQLNDEFQERFKFA